MDRLLEIKDFLDDGYNIAKWLNMSNEEWKSVLQQKQVALTDVTFDGLHDELFSKAVLRPSICNLRI